MELLSIYPKTSMINFHAGYRNNENFIIASSIESPAKLWATRTVH